MSATPTTGEPPLLVTFSPSGTDADAGDTIASYTINFGDGSASVTQNCTATCPTIQHTYTTNGDFGVQVKVTDSRGKISSNTALLDIGVELPLDRVVSDKAHGTVGSFDVVLYDLSVHPDGTGEIECRTEGSGYAIIYTFGSEYTVTGQASSTPTITNGGTVASHGPGPGANQYQVHFTGVTNAQHHVVTTTGVPVHNSTAGSPNGGNATLNNAAVEFDLLVGDVNQTKRTDSGDVTQVRNHTVSIPDQTTFRFDVNASGRIDAGDVTVTRNSSVTVLQ